MVINYKQLMAEFSHKFANFKEKLNLVTTRGYVIAKHDQRVRTIFALTILGVILIPEFGFALDDKTDPFADQYKTISGWVKGSAGKLITLISAVVAMVLGGAGFAPKWWLGSIGVGLMLATVCSFIEVLFK